MYRCTKDLNIHHRKQKENEQLSKSDQQPVVYSSSSSSLSASTGRVIISFRLPVQCELYARQEEGTALTSGQAVEQPLPP